MVVLDEFQEIVNFNGEALERQLRAAIQHHRNVSYLFAGSKPHMLIDMVSEKTRPFYQMGSLMTLDRMPQDEFRSFIETKFLKSGKKIAPAALDRIFKTSENVPHYVQPLSFYLWDHFQDITLIEEAHVNESISMVLRGKEPAYLTIREGLTLHQRKTIKAAAFLEGRLLSSKETIQRFHLESASNVGKSLRSLCSKGILRRENAGYVFEDVLFGQWVKENA